MCATFSFSGWEGISLAGAVYAFGVSELVEVLDEGADLFAPGFVGVEVLVDCTNDRCDLGRSTLVSAASTVRMTMAIACSSAVPADFAAHQDARLVRLNGDHPAGPVPLAEALAHADDGPPGADPADHGVRNRAVRQLGERLRT